MNTTSTVKQAAQCRCGHSIWLTDDRFDWHFASGSLCGGSYSLPEGAVATFEYDADWQLIR